MTPLSFPGISLILQIMANDPICLPWCMKCSQEARDCVRHIENGMLKNKSLENHTLHSICTQPWGAACVCAFILPKHSKGEVVVVQ